MRHIPDDELVICDTENFARVWGELKGADVIDVHLWSIYMGQQIACKLVGQDATSDG
jgi:hypothetical protein